MRYLQADIDSVAATELQALKVLPRPLYGHLDALPNRAIGYRHSHKWIQLSYAAKGVVEVITDSSRFIAPPLCAVWVPAGFPHAVHCTEVTQIRSLYIDPAVLPNARTGCRVLSVTPLLRELIRAFSEYPVEYDERGEHGRLVNVLLDQLGRAPDMALELPWPMDARLRKVCSDLQAHVDSHDTLECYSKKLNVSEKTLSRLFLRETGLSFRLWRQRLRLLSSLALLERGDRVTDVALACGYDSMSAFIAAFRELIGVTPREFFAARH